MATGLRSIWIIFCGLLLVACQGIPKTETGAIYLVRHAEKVTDGGAMIIEDPRDPPLTVGGEARAAALADTLETSGITQIWSSDYIRTRDTAAPLAARLGLEVNLYDPSDLESFAELLLANQSETVLVVGHSNTTPQLVEALGGDGGSPIVEKSEYDRLYVFYPETKKTELRRYGVPSIIG